MFTRDDRQVKYVQKVSKLLKFIDDKNFSNSLYFHWFLNKKL
jgi:hypothetical protein